MFVMKIRRLFESKWFMSSALVAMLAVETYLNTKVTISGPAMSLIEESSLSVTGFNGDGMVSPSFHPEAKTIDYLSATARQENNRLLNDLLASIRCTASSYTGLSNGDSITYACTYDKSLERAARYRLKDVERTYIVEGLPEYTPIDYFSGVSLYYSVVDNHLSIEMEIDEKYTQMGIEYEAIETLQNVHLYAHADAETLRQYGYLPGVETAIFDKPAPPKAITSLTDEETEEIQQNVLARVLADIETCKEHLPFDVATDHIQMISFSFNDDDSCTITYATDKEQLYIVSYTGFIYRRNDGTVAFVSDENHGCEFSKDIPHMLETIDLGS